MCVRAFYSIRLCNINVLLMVGGSEEAFPAAGRTVNNSSGSRGADSGHAGAGCGPRRGKEPGCVYVWEGAAQAAIDACGRGKFLARRGNVLKSTRRRIRGSAWDVRLTNLGFSFAFPGAV